MSYRAGVDKAKKKTGRTWEHGDKVDQWRDGYRQGVIEALAWAWRALGSDAREIIEAEAKRRGLEIKDG